MMMMMMMTVLMATALSLVGMTHVTLTLVFVRLKTLSAPRSLVGGERSAGIVTLLGVPEGATGVANCCSSATHQIFDYRAGWGGCTAARSFVLCVRVFVCLCDF